MILSNGNSAYNGYGKDWAGDRTGRQANKQTNYKQMQKNVQNCVHLCKKHMTNTLSCIARHEKDRNHVPFRNPLCHYSVISIKWQFDIMCHRGRISTQTQKMIPPDGWGWDETCQYREAKNGCRPCRCMHRERFNVIFDIYAFVLCAFLVGKCERSNEPYIVYKLVEI